MIIWFAIKLQTLCDTKSIVCIKRSRAHNREMNSYIRQSLFIVLHARPDWNQGHLCCENVRTYST